MTSKEALEELKDEIIPDYALEYEEDEGYKNWVNELYLTIKQDLERKEKLEKVIEILKQFISLDLECNIIYEIRMGREMIVISQQEYELLKEVLGE